MICEGSSTKSRGVPARPRYGTCASSECKRVAELVEQRLHFLDAQQRRGVARRPREVAHVDDDGADALAVREPLFAKPAAPGAHALPGAGVVVGVEHAEVRSVGVLHLERLHLGVIGRQVGARHEREPVQPVGHVEDALAHLVELEVRTQRLVVEVVARLAQLLGVVAPVPRFDGDAPPLPPSPPAATPRLPRWPSPGPAPRAVSSRS